MTYPALRGMVNAQDLSVKKSNEEVFALNQLAFHKTDSSNALESSGFRNGYKCPQGFQKHR